MGEQLDIFFPNLVLDDCVDELICLQCLLSKANPVRASKNDNYESNLLAACMTELPQSTPAAAIGALGCGLDSQQAYWLQMQFVHWQADMRTAYCYHLPQQLALTHEHAKQLLADVNPLLEEQEVIIHTISPGNYYLQSQKECDLQTYTLQAMLGKPLGDALPQGRDQHQWRQLLTEIQMILAHHPINTWRQQQGLLSINSVWFGGGGVLPKIQQAPWQWMIGNDVYTQGLAKLTRTTYHEIEHLEELKLTSRFLEQGTGLLVWQTPFYHEENRAPLLEQWQKLELMVFAPLQRILQQGLWRKVSLHFAKSKDYDLNRSRIWFGWRARAIVGAK